MANSGNVWHSPDSAEPRGRSGIRDCARVVVAGVGITVISGNRFPGDGNAGNQLEAGGALTCQRVGVGVFGDQSAQLNLIATPRRTGLRNRVVHYAYRRCARRRN